MMRSRTDGEEMHVILGTQMFQKFYGLRIAPDGQRLLFAAMGAGNNYVAPRAGLLNSLGALARNFGPAVAYADGEIYDLWTIGLDGRDLRRVTQLAEDLPMAAWAPDGRQIAFVRVFGFSSRATQETFLMNADGTHQHLLHKGAKQLAPAWQPLP